MARQGAGGGTARRQQSEAFHDDSSSPMDIDCRGGAPLPEAGQLQCGTPNYIILHSERHADAGRTQWSGTPQ
jgi:hypothetical protein